MSLGESFLTLTKIYVKQLLPLIKIEKKFVKAMIHITGGGFVDNIPRVLPENFGANINSNSWELPQVFKWLASNGNISSGICIIIHYYIYELLYINCKS